MRHSFSHPYVLLIQASEARTMLVAESIVIVVILILLLILIIIILACKPWRFFTFSRNRLIKDDDVDRPLISEKVGLVDAEGGGLDSHSVFEGLGFQSEGESSSSDASDLAYNHSSSKAPPALGEGLILDVIPEHPYEVSPRITLKRALSSSFPEEQRPSNQQEVLSYDIKIRSDTLEDGNYYPSSHKGILNPRSCLSLEVVSGPSRGLCYYIKSTDTFRLPLILGRLSPSDLLLKDTEVSGKHASVRWNLDKMKWEMVDLGSLNGTLLNSHAIDDLESGSRHRGNPIELESGDIITLGTTSKIHVQITSEIDCPSLFKVEIATDPMTLHRGGKKLPMEDACFCEWSLHGENQFGLFGICDGHGGADAAKSASKILPKAVAAILADKRRTERVILEYDASDVLREAFYQTEARLNYYYEGCTATMLLIWTDGEERYYAQCANVGDSACIISIDGETMKMTEDHRISSHGERLRINSCGERMKDGETRLCGINIGRMLGDKFLKQQDSRFISEPYISQVVHVQDGFALLASDGLWDVMSIKKASQIVLQMKKTHGTESRLADKAASYLLNEARLLRTKDNTSVIFIQFNTTPSSLT